MAEPARKRIKTGEDSTDGHENRMETAMNWSSEQRRAIDAALSGRNVFITGPGGVGKSAIIPFIVSALREKRSKMSCITATTGVAAIAIGGKTLHGFAGIGLGTDPVNVCISKLQKNRVARNRWWYVDVLIVDEVSMLNPSFFDKLDKIGRALRRNSAQPFGGIQLILSGDFLQIPPVPQGGRSDPSEQTLLFDTDTWKNLNLVCVKMERSFRQNDKDFVELLNRARYGVLTPEDVAVLRTRINVTLDVASGITPTRIYSRNAAVEAENETHLKKCAAPDYLYQAKFYDAEGRQIMGNVPENVMSGFAVDKTIKLRAGAQVMLLANIKLSSGLANGSRGVVTGFTPKTSEKGGVQYPVVRFCNGAEEVIGESSWDKILADGSTVGCKQIPLRLAWAITIHKSQGCSLDCGVVSIDSSVFEYGQAYVALSRFRNLNGMSLTSFQPEVVRANPNVANYYNQLI